MNVGNWEDQDVVYKRTLLFMIVRAQKGLTIDVGPFTRLDAPATVSVSI